MTVASSFLIPRDLRLLGERGGTRVKVFDPSLRWRSYKLPSSGRMILSWPGRP